MVVMISRFLTISHHFFVQILTWIMIMMMMLMIRMVMYCISQEVGASDTEPGCLEMLILILI